MEIRRVETDAERADTFAVRRRVFVEEQGVPEELELDGRDEEATHFVAYEGRSSDEPRSGDRNPNSPAVETAGTPIGAARLRERDETVGKVERVAVVESRRGEGIGRALMDAIEIAAREAGHNRLVLHAQVPVVGFYDRLGYEVTSEEFLDAGIPHRKMEKSL